MLSPSFRRRVVPVALATAVALTTLPAVASAATAIAPPPAALLAGLQDLSGQEWALGAVNAEPAWSLTRGAGTTVAVIDTGVDPRHPDLADRLVPGGIADASGQVVPASLAATADGEGHGTHVAGIVAADRDGRGVTGIAPEARIMPVRVVTPATAFDDAATFLLTVSRGIRFATAHGADVINLSVGTQSSGLAGATRAAVTAAAAEVCQAVADATTHGTVVVAAAGNDGLADNPSTVPADCPGVISVGAVDESLHRAYFSSYGAATTLAAPGVDVLSSVPASFVTPGAPAFALMSGTSMASPVVAGVAALVRSAHPDWTAQQVRDALTGSATDLGPAGRDVQYGYGLVDAAAALGIAAPPATASNYFAVQASPLIDPVSGTEDDSRAELAWTPPQAGTPSSYVVSIFRGASVSRVDLPGDAVRTELHLARGDWYQVVARYPDGDVAAYPGVWAPVVPEVVASPAPVRAVRATRSGTGTVTVSWAAPLRPGTVKWVHVMVAPKGADVLHAYLPVRAGKAFPTRSVLRLSGPAALYADASVIVATVNTSSDGFDIVETPVALRTVLAAPRGLHVAAIDRAGRGRVLVRGTVSAANARRVCRTTTCTGRAVTVDVLLGHRHVRVTGHLTSRGAFYVPMRLVTSQRVVKVRVTGTRLTSGWQSVRLT